MNKSVPTMLGIVIILLVVVLAVSIINYKLYKGLSEGQRLVGTVGGEMMTGVEAPREFTDEASALGGQAERPESKPSPAMRTDTPGAEAREEITERRERAEEGLEEPMGPRERPVRQGTTPP